MGQVMVLSKYSIAAHAGTARRSQSEYCGETLRLSFSHICILFVLVVVSGSAVMMMNDNNRRQNTTSDRS